MSILDHIKNKAKKAASNAGWENINQKKEEIIYKAKQLKNEHDSRQRQKKEDWVYKKEIELKDFEKKLNEREKIIKQKERKLSQKFFVRFVLLAGGFSMIGLFVLVNTVDLNGSNSVENNITNLSMTKADKSTSYTNKKSSEYPLSIPSDPGVKYYVLNKEGTKDMPILVTKRIGSSGTSYAKRIFDCKNKTTKYLGDGDTIAEMNNSSPSPSMGGIYPQSIAWYQWNHVCNN
jgi:hypothetical protein